MVRFTVAIYWPPDISKRRSGGPVLELGPDHYYRCEDSVSGLLLTAARSQQVFVPWSNVAFILYPAPEAVRAVPPPPPVQLSLFKDSPPPPPQVTASVTEEPQTQTEVTAAGTAKVTDEVVTLSIADRVTALGATGKRRGRPKKHPGT